MLRIFWIHWRTIGTGTKAWYLKVLLLFWMSRTMTARGSQKSSILSWLLKKKIRKATTKRGTVSVTIAVQKLFIWLIRESRTLQKAMQKYWQMTHHLWTHRSCLNGNFKPRRTHAGCLCWQACNLDLWPWLRMAKIFAAARQWSRGWGCRIERLLRKLPSNVRYSSALFYRRGKKWDVNTVDVFWKQHEWSENCTK